MLLDSKNREHFRDHSRSMINDIAGGNSPGSQEARQAKLLAPLREKHVLHHHKGFSLGERAYLIK